VDALGEIEALVEVEGRVAGSDAERRAGRHLELRLADLGRDAETQPISIFPAWDLAHALHAALAIAGSVVAVGEPIVGTALVLAALVSLAGDATGAFHLARRLTGRRASQNVISREAEGKPGVLVLVAHYDTARTGAVFGPRPQERWAALGRLLRRPLSPLGPLVWSTVLILACSAVRIPGVDGQLLTAVQFVPTVVLILHMPLLIDVALSDPVPGANDNASGVATALRLAERHGGELEHFELWVVFTGSQEAFALGMREFLRRHRRVLDAEHTVFVNLDELGAGRVRYTRREGLVLTGRSHPQLVGLCEEIAEDDPDAHARALVSRSPSDAAAARAAGFPSITICCRNALDYVPHHHRPGDTPEHVDPEALERSFGFCSELVRRLDEEVGPNLARG
jgi:hypothetical protein